MDYQLIDLLGQMSNLDKETNNSDDSFNIVKVGMDTGELDEVSFICELIDNGDNSSNGDEDNGWLLAVLDISILNFLGLLQLL